MANIKSSSTEPSQELKAALDAAKAAAEVIRGFYQRNVRIEVKADKTPVTEADVRSEEAIRDLLMKRFPSYGFYGEETGKSDMNAESVWLVDPIDGTKSFVRECPFFSTQIALMRGGRLVLGVSMAPAYDEVAWAERGSGAFLNGKQINVSKVAALDAAIVSTGNLKTLAASPASTPAASTSTSGADTPPPAPVGVITRARTGVRRPSTRYPSTEYICAASTSAPSSALSPVPTSARAALRDPHWHAAMQEEFDALQRNQTWALVPRPPCANVITVKWVFKHKLQPDGTLERYKARWVVHGFRQRAGVDLTDRFALVVKLGTICTVLHLAASRAWPVHQMDVSNAFFMDTSPSRCTVSSPPASSTPITPSMCACSRAPCMA
jgi:hypothetical protein